MTGTVIYAVHVSNYEPPEVVALYTNRAAAVAHVANCGGMLEVSPLNVESEYTLGAYASCCAACKHSLVRLGNQWTCSERCRCTMAGCAPRRTP